MFKYKYIIMYLYDPPQNNNNSNFHEFTTNLHTTNCRGELHTTALIIFLDGILLKYNFILKSPSFVLGFTSFLLWKSPELLMTLQSSDT